MIFAVFLHVTLACPHTYIKLQQGHRCVTNTEIYTNISDTSQQRCIWHCLKDVHCDVINYNAITGLCRLSLEKCMYFQWDLDYIVVAMTMTEPCLSWVSITDVDMNSAISSPVNDGSGKKLFTVRGISNGDMIAGKYDKFNQKAYYIASGAEVEFYDPEFLVARDGCTVEWVMYDSVGQSPFPTGAIVGGWLQGAPIYVARKYQQYHNPSVNSLSGGYYDKATGLGHMGWGGADIVMTSAEILVLKNWDELKTCTQW